MSDEAAGLIGVVVIGVIGIPAGALLLGISVRLFGWAAGF